MPQKINPPVHTHAQTLPFDDLAWENFERLCLHLALNHGSVESSSDHAAGDVATGRMSARDARAQGRLYGKRGQKQQGIDLYVLLSEFAAGEGAGKQRPYLSLQSRRIAALSATALQKAVTDFLGGSWASVSSVFVYATSVSAVRTNLADEIKTQTARLAGKNIGFEVWDAEQLSISLKTQATLVHDFFGRAWVEEFCEPGALNSIGSRLDAVQVAEFREQLGGFYASFFDITDSGAVALQQADVPRMEFRQRFVLPM